MESMIQAQPVKIISIPTNRPITHKAALGHCRLINKPSNSVMQPFRSTQPQPWKRYGQPATERRP